MPEPSKNREDYLEERNGSLGTTVSHAAQDLGEHISELRKRVLISLAAFALSLMLCFNFSGEIIKFLQAAAPDGASFFQLKPGELFMSSFRVALFSAIVFSLPVILIQIAKFANPGLKEEEKKIFIPVFYIIPFFTVLGIAFAYYFALPPLLDFLLGFREGVVETRYGLEHFLNLEISILGLCAVCFQLPILIVVLSFFKIVNSSQLLSIWRYVVLGAFIVAAILTPTPDPLTMTIVAMALLGLYFTTVFALKFMKK